MALKWQKKKVPIDIQNVSSLAHLLFIILSSLFSEQWLKIIGKSVIKIACTFYSGTIYHRIRKKKIQCGISVVHSFITARIPNFGGKGIMFSQGSVRSQEGTPWSCHWFCPWSCRGWEVPYTRTEGTPNQVRGTIPHRTRTDVWRGWYVSCFHAGGLPCLD